MSANLTMVICFKMKECKKAYLVIRETLTMRKNSLTAMNHVFIPDVLVKYNHEFSRTAFCSSDVHSKVRTTHANKRVIVR